MSSFTHVKLPGASGIRSLELSAPAKLVTSALTPTSRNVYAAGHVVADALQASPGDPTVIDWDATMAVRESLWDLGLGVAESMDTAQRGMGLDATTAIELGKRSVRRAAERGSQVVVGISSDQVEPGSLTLAGIADAYIEQLEEIEGAGGTVVMMASRELAKVAHDRDDYLQVYGRVLSRATRPVVLHWLGTMFDQELKGYWGADHFDAAADTVVALMQEHRDSIAGIKLSLLDAFKEVTLRNRLPEGVRLFTGDDFNYPELIAGDESGHSDALLGAFAAVPRFASAAFARLDKGDISGFREILDSTVPLSRLIFEAPTKYYKVGVVWLSYLTGGQSHFKMVAGYESGRSLEHLVQVFEEANRIGLFADPDFAADRASGYFQGIGVL